MLKKIICSVSVLFALSSPSFSQAYDPWAGYETRDIRELRHQASERRERLRDLAAKSYAERNGVEIIRDGYDEPRKIDLSLSSSKRPTSRPSEDVSEPVTDMRVFHEMSVTQSSPRPLPRPEGLGVKPWTGKPLDVSSGEIYAVMRKYADAPYANKPQVIYANMTASGYAMAGSSLRAVVDISTQTMTLTDGGKVIANWPVSTGRKGYPSDKGTFRVSFLSRNHKSSIYNNAPMPCSIFYNGGEAIHGTNDIANLGRRASHGCVRLQTSNACKLFDMVQSRGKSSLIVHVKD